MQMNTKTLLTGLGCTTALALGTPAQAELITNGGLELPGGGFHNYTVGSELGTHRFGPLTFGETVPDSWTRVGDRGWTVSDLAGNAFPAASGDYAYRLDTSSEGGEDKLEQSGIELVAGQEYDFSIDMWSEFSSGADLTVELYGTGLTTINVLTGYVDSVDGVENVKASFTATESGTFTISMFATQDGVSSNHTWIDNASLVPEPSSLALLGLGGLLVARRRR